MSWSRRQGAPGLRATGEQEAAVEAFLSRQHLALQAGAGTGKTTTLTLLAEADRRRGRYLSFNKSIATDAAQKFPPNVACRTAHSLAYEAVGHRYDQRLRAPRKPAWRAGAALGIAPSMQVRIGDRTVTNRGLSYAVVRTVRRFCQSADTVLCPHHVPWLRGLAAEDLHQQLVKIVLPYAQRAWDDLQEPAGGAMRFEHDHYLKMWALGQPVIGADYLLLDEAQDTNPVLEQVFTAQRAHAQLVMVGDSAQAIYGWRGARDVMTGFDGAAGPVPVLPVRPRAGPGGQPVAGVPGPDPAGRRHRHPPNSPVRHPDAILCRTNVGAMAAVLRLLADNRRVALVGGGKALARPGAGRRRNSRPDAAPPTPNWCSSAPGANSGVRRIRPCRAATCCPWSTSSTSTASEVILAAVDASPRSTTPDRRLHRPPGQGPGMAVRADRPRLQPRPAEETDSATATGPPAHRPDEARLAYVAVTRARHHLDPGGLAWFDRHPDAPPRRPAAARPPADRAGPEGSPWDRLGPRP